MVQQCVLSLSQDKTGLWQLGRNKRQPELGGRQGRMSRKEGHPWQQGRTNLPKERSLQGKDDFALLVKVKLSETSTTCYIKLMQLLQGLSMPVLLNLFYIPQGQ